MGGRGTFTANRTRPVRRFIPWAATLGFAFSCFDVLDLGGTNNDNGPDRSGWGDPASAPCEDPHHTGDGRSGLQCWDPPENYCRDGISPANAWYCKSDASKCCLAVTGECFRCGWVRMNSCTVAGGTPGAPQPDCDLLKADLPDGVRSCLDTNGNAPECGAIFEDPECTFDASGWICPEG